MPTSKILKNVEPKSFQIGMVCKEKSEVCIEHNKFVYRKFKELADHIINVVSYETF